MLNNYVANTSIIEILYNNSYSEWKISEKAIELYKLRSNITEFELADCCRNDPILVQIYKELGNDFNDKSSRTNIKKIPKKYKNYYFIGDDCGKEYISIDKTGYIYYKIKEILQSTNNNDLKINEIEQFISIFVI